MSRRILISCFEIPGWGGAATCAYLLFRRLQRDGWDVAYVNLVDARQETFLRTEFGPNWSNPSALDAVHTCLLPEPLWRPHAALSELTQQFAPDLMLGVGFIAALLMKWATPELPLAFFTVGSLRLQRLIEAGIVADFIEFERAVRAGIAFPEPAVDRERAAIEASEIVFSHSPLMRTALETFFPEHRGRIYANDISVADFIYSEAEAYLAARRPFAERDIDVLFVASRWTRSIKNYDLVRRIVADCDGMSVHIVGAFDTPCPGAQHHGLVAQRDRIYALLGRTRVLVCPSLLDAAPGILFEASAMGCNVVASPNCGNSALCDDQLLARDCSAETFIAAVRRAQRHPYADRRQEFAGGYADLVDTLSVF